MSERRTGNAGTYDNNINIVSGAVPGSAFPANGGGCGRGGALNGLYGISSVIFLEKQSVNQKKT